MICFCLKRKNKQFYLAISLEGRVDLKMEATMINPDEIDCIAYMNKKRKLEDELLGLPSPKHVCWSQRLVCDSSYDSTIEPKMVRSSIVVRGVESEPESASYSCIFPGDADVSMSPHDDSKTYVEATASSTSPDAMSYYIDPYSPESRLLTKPSSSKFESPTISEELHSLYLEYGLKLPDIESHPDCSLSAYQDDVFEGCMDEDIDHKVYSNEAIGCNYVLSSGRWPVKQDSQEGSRKPTIDKEFEQYFSALML